MSRSNYLKQSILDYILNGVAPTFEGDDSVFLSLHLEDPLNTLSQDQTSHEVSFNGYERLKLEKKSAPFTLTKDSANNSQDLSMAYCISGGAVAKFWAIGRKQNGMGDVLYSGSIDGSSGLGIGPMSIPYVPKNLLSIIEGG